MSTPDRARMVRPTDRRQVSPAIGDFALRERPRLLAEISMLRKIIADYLAWSDRAPERECIVSIQQRMREAVSGKAGGV